MSSQTNKSVLLLLMAVGWCLVPAPVAKAKDANEQDVRKMLAVLPEVHGESKPDIPKAMKDRMIELQPILGDALLDIIEDLDDKLNRRATNALLKIWDSLSNEQIENYFVTVFELWAEYRQLYPVGIEAYIAMNYRLNEFSWSGVPEAEDVRIKTTTRHFLDAEPYRKAFSYEGPGARTGSIRTEDLELGEHSFYWITKYEVTYRDRIFKGKVKSEVCTFEIVEAAEIDELGVEPNEDLEKQVRESFQITEIRSDYDTLHKRRGEKPNPWNPQARWTNKNGEIFGVHTPVWKVTKKLPVDLCFDVEFHLEDTAEVFEGRRFVVLKGNTVEWNYFYLDGWQEFVKGRDSFVPVIMVLKPSKDAAFSNPYVTGYYNGQIKTDVMRIKIWRWIKEKSSQVIKRYKQVWDNIKNDFGLENIKVLAAELDDENLDVRIDAIKELREIIGLDFGFESAIDVNDKHTMARWQAAKRAWREYPKNLEMAINKKVPLLLQQADVMNQGHRAEAALFLGSDAPHPAFLSLLEEVVINHNEDTLTCWMAIKAITLIPHEGMVEFLIEQLDTDMAFHAWKQLYKLTKPEVYRGEKDWKELKKEYEKWWAENKENFKYDRSRVVDY